MRYPNRRYAHPDELRYYMRSMTPAQLAAYLKRDERTVKNWLSGAVRCPWWVPELLRLRAYEVHNQLRQMGIDQKLGRLGIVKKSQVLYFDPPPMIEEPKTVVEQLNDMLISRYKG